MSRLGLSQRFSLLSCSSHYEKFSDGRVVCIEDEIPFEVPAGWEWARMSSLSSVIHYGFTASAGLSGNAKLLRITDIQDGKVQWDDVPFCEIDKKGLCNYQLENDDIVIARTGGTVGKSFVISNISVVAVFASYLIRIKPVPGLYIPYIATYLESPCYWRQLTDATSGTGQPNVNGQSLSNLLVPIPPFDEQMRIVVERNNIYSHLQKYTTAQDRIDALNESLREILKKSVLQEAIHGRLVPQDPREEPASVLLEQIREEKRKLLKEGKLKKKDLVDSIIIKGEDNKYYEQVGGKVLDISDEIPFDLPDTWAWSRFSVIAHYQIGKTPTRGESSFWASGTIPWVSISDMKEYGLVSQTKERITQKAASILGDITRKGTLIMSFKLTVGRTSILDIDAYHNEAIISIWPFVDTETMRPYLYYTLPLLANLGDSKDAIKGRTLNTNSINNLLIPIPPSNEQIAIVRRIEDLYARL